MTDPLLDRMAENETHAPLERTGYVLIEYIARTRSASYFDHKCYVKQLASEYKAQKAAPQAGQDISGTAPSQEGHAAGPAVAATVKPALNLKLCASAVLDGFLNDCQEGNMPMLQAMERALDNLEQAMNEDDEQPVNAAATQAKRPWTEQSEHGGTGAETGPVPVAAPLPLTCEQIAQNRDWFKRKLCDANWKETNSSRAHLIDELCDQALAAIELRAEVERLERQLANVQQSLREQLSGNEELNRQLAEVRAATPLERGLTDEQIAEIAMRFTHPSSVGRSASPLQVEAAIREALRLAGKNIVPAVPSDLPSPPFGQH